MRFSCNWILAGTTQHFVIPAVEKYEEIQLLQAKFDSQVNLCTF